MHDATVVGGGQSVRSLERVINHFPDRQSPVAQAVTQALAFEQFADDVGAVVMRADVIHSEDVGMVEGGSGASLLLEAPHATGVAGERPRDNFHGNVAAESPVVCAIHLTHATGANRAGKFVGTELDSHIQRHRRLVKNGHHCTCIAGCAPGWCAAGRSTVLVSEYFVVARIRGT
jgi:hypothetical protein